MEGDIDEFKSIVNDLYSISLFREPWFSSSYTDYKSWILSSEIPSYLSRLLNSDKAEYKKLTNENLVDKYLNKHTDNCDKSREILRATTIELYLKMLSDKL